MLCVMKKLMMKIIDTIDEMRKYISECQVSDKSIGLVPTMGYLHKGHMSLAERSVFENDITILSIFVNPAQFAPNEDFEKYPRNMEQDCNLADKAGVDVVFAPAADDMYGKGYSTYIDVLGVSQPLCGLSRPGHFRGVATVVAKLFNICKAQKAYFGQKDFQQTKVIERMVKDLNMDIDIVVCPIVREKDGLAMSSRNVYLTNEQREQATCLYRSLEEAKRMIGRGEKRIEIIHKRVKEVICQNNLAEIEYVSILDAENLNDIQSIEQDAVLALAVKFGSTRLIDNCVLKSVKKVSSETWKKPFAN